MSDVKAQCSNCGAELSNITFSWGKRQWLWSLIGFIPLLLFFFWFPGWMFRENRAFVTELQVVLVETKVAQGRLNILGQLKNNGSQSWDRITVEAEVYDKDGKFLDETSDYLAMLLVPGSEENFRLTLASPDGKTLDPSSKVVLKITDADEDRF